MFQHCVLALLVMTSLFGGAYAQSTLKQFEEEHDLGVKQNPPGVSFSIATTDGRSAFHLSEWVKFRLIFVSKKASVYTADLAPGGAAGTADHFILQPTESPTIFHLGGGPSVCCWVDRRSIKPKSTPGRATVMFSNLRPYSLHPFDPFASPSAFSPLPPGEFDLFIQTRRVLHGWPKTQREKYEKLSDLVVTSSNILHITLLPDEALPEPPIPAKQIH